MEEKSYTEEEAHDYFARSLNGEVWHLLEQKDRTPADEQRMVHAAHASLYHWLHAGTAVHLQRALWLLSRVYGEIGWGEAALHHAHLCEELTRDHPSEMEDFDRAYALEGMARANIVMGNLTLSARYRERARKAGEAIADAEHRKLFLSDLEGGSWQPAG